jgi:hypothetical protein
MTVFIEAVARLARARPTRSLPLSGQWQFCENRIWRIGFDVMTRPRLLLPARASGARPANAIGVVAI